MQHNRNQDFEHKNDKQNAIVDSRPDQAVLHIGSGNSSTTTIKSLIFNFEKALSKDNYSVPHSMPGPFPSVTISNT
jgi:hypothetical protein